MTEVIDLVGKFHQIISIVNKEKGNMEMRQNKMNYENLEWVIVTVCNVNSEEIYGH